MYIFTSFMQPANLMQLTNKSQQMVLALQEKYYQMVQESMTKTNEFFQQQQNKCMDACKNNQSINCFESMKQTMDAQYQYAQKMIEIANRISHESLDILYKAYSECKPQHEQGNMPGTGMSKDNRK